MFATHWNLKSSPFREGASGPVFHQGPAQAESLARLDYVIENHRRVGLLVGKRGVGKSLLLDRLAQKWAVTDRLVARLSLHGADAREMLWRVAAQLGLNPGLDEAPFILWRRIDDQMAASSLARRGVVLLLDDADETYPDAIPQMVRLAQCEAIGDLQLSLVLSAHPQRLQRLGRRLLDLVDLCIQVAVWEELDIRKYLAASLQAAGVLQSPFDDQAVARLFELSGGVPRVVRQMAELALLVGAAHQFDSITSEVIDAVHGELSLTGQRATILV
jgi:general secretion pathway protein A